MSDKTDNDAARVRVERLIASEARLPFAKERAAAYRMLVEYNPRLHCAPSDAVLSVIAEALTAYEADRPLTGFVDARNQARAHVNATKGRSQEGDYINTAIVAYEYARRGEVRP